MTEKKTEKKAEKKKSVVIEIAGKKFDSSEGVLNMGDLEALEHAGVDFTKLEGGSLPISKTNIVTKACLSKANPEAGVNDEFVNAIPTTMLGEVMEFVADFFGRNFPVGQKRS